MASGAGIGIFDLLAMTFRKSRSARDRAQQDHGGAVGLGRIDRASRPRPSKPITWRAAACRCVMRAIIAAHKAKMIALDFKLATSIDLAGRDVLEAVQTSVYPKVIDCPARGSAKKRSTRWPKTASN